MKESVRVLLDGQIDYAGLFPPASLPIEEAVARYDRYQRSPHAWALGRFVVPLARIDVVPPLFPSSVLVTPDELQSLDARIDTVEVKAAEAREVERIATGAKGRTVYVETADINLLPAISASGLRAKIRTGGVTADAFPAPEEVAAFIQRCASLRLPFKATAGLHHPVRCLKPLTYEANAPTGTMHGFVNVFIAAAVAYARPGVDLIGVLMETDAKAFELRDDVVRWRDVSVTLDELAAARREFATSFGSCSFEEPLADLAELGWL